MSSLSLGCKKTRMLIMLENVPKRQILLVVQRYQEILAGPEVDAGRLVPGTIVILLELVPFDILVIFMSESNDLSSKSMLFLSNSFETILISIFLLIKKEKSKNSLFIY